jgi:hypothetical protein
LTQHEHRIRHHRKKEAREKYTVFGYLQLSAKYMSRFKSKAAAINKKKHSASANHSYTQHDCADKDEGLF